MSVIVNNYHKNLTALKEVLPKGYQRKIVESCDGLTINDVKKAFSNRLKDPNKLLKILTCAQNVARRYQAEQKDSLQKTIEILANKAVAFSPFFALLCDII